MSRQVINNTNVNPDTLQSAMTKCNSNFNELYSSVSAITVTTKTSQLINDGDDGVNPFITLADIPKSISISGVTDLNSVLSQIQNDIEDNTNQIVTLNDTISKLNGVINTQNQQIATMQSQILDLYNIINNL